MNIRRFFALSAALAMITITAACSKDKRGGTSPEPPIETEPLTAIFEVSRTSGVEPLAVIRQNAVKQA